MTLYRITLSYTPTRCSKSRWIKGFVLADSEVEAWRIFKSEVGDERCGKGNSHIEVVDENKAYIYKQEF